MERARSYVDTRYKHRGRDRVRGIDCAGLWILVMNDLGISNFDTQDYSTRPKPIEFRRAMLQAGFTSVDKLEHGAVLRVYEHEWPVHTAIYELDDQDREWIIHAWLPAKKVIRERLDADRKQRIVEIMRFPS